MSILTRLFKHGAGAKKDMGTYGEDHAVRMLKKAGCKVLERNFRTRMGEIDVVADEDGTLLFVEVKTRGKHSIAKPFESVDRRKQEKIIKASLEYLSKNNIDEDTPIRFDVISIVVDGESVDTEYIKNAFDMDG
ncbi:MAG: YraN family protein [Deltaproteobacteria bacterium]|nr:YraN family protein [Deltaproteobacteria bacterium]